MNHPQQPYNPYYNNPYYSIQQAHPQQQQQQPQPWQPIHYQQPQIYPQLPYPIATFPQSSVPVPVPPQQQVVWLPCNTRDRPTDFNNLHIGTIVAKVTPDTVAVDFDDPVPGGDSTPYRSTPNGKVLYRKIVPREQLQDLGKFLENYNNVSMTTNCTTSKNTQFARPCMFSEKIISSHPLIDIGDKIEIKELGINSVATGEVKRILHGDGEYCIGAEFTTPIYEGLLPHDRNRCVAHCERLLCLQVGRVERGWWEGGKGGVVIWARVPPYGQRRVTFDELLMGSSDSSKLENNKSVPEVNPLATVKAVIGKPNWADFKDVSSSGCHGNDANNNYQIIGNTPITTQEKPQPPISTGRKNAFLEELESKLKICGGSSRVSMETGMKSKSGAKTVSNDADEAPTSPLKGVPIFRNPFVLDEFMGRRRSQGRGGGSGGIINHGNGGVTIRKPAIAPKPFGTIARAKRGGEELDTSTSSWRNGAPSVGREVCAGSITEFESTPSVGGGEVDFQESATIAAPPVEKPQQKFQFHEQRPIESPSPTTPPTPTPSTTPTSNKKAHPLLLLAEIQEKGRQKDQILRPVETPSTNPSQTENPSSNNIATMIRTAMESRRVFNSDNEDEDYDSAEDEDSDDWEC